MSDILNNNSPFLSTLKTLNQHDGHHKLLSNGLSSLNFDGYIPKTFKSKYAADVKQGDVIFLGDPFYSDNQALVTDIQQDVNGYKIFYLSSESIVEQFTYNSSNGYFASNDQINVVSDEIDKIDIGKNGWSITNNGTAVFSDVFVRGRIEATDGIFDGKLTAGIDDFGSPLMQLGKDIFNGDVFYPQNEVVDSPNISQGIEANGIYINPYTYLLSYNKETKDSVSSIEIIDPLIALPSDIVPVKKYNVTISYSNLNLKENFKNIFDASITKTISGSINTSVITVDSLDGLDVDMQVSGTGIGTNAYIVSINTVNNQITLSVKNSGAVSGNGTFKQDLKNSLFYLQGMPYASLNGTQKIISVGTDSFTIQVSDSTTLQNAVSLSNCTAESSMFDSPLTLNSFTIQEISSSKYDVTFKVFLSSVSKYSIDDTIFFTGMLPTNNLIELSDNYYVISSIDTVNKSLTIQSPPIYSSAKSNGTFTPSAGELWYVTKKSQYADFGVGGASGNMYYDSVEDSLVLTGQLIAGVTGYSKDQPTIIGSNITITRNNTTGSYYDGIYFDDYNYWVSWGEDYNKKNTLVTSEAVMYKPVVQIGSSGIIKTAETTGNGQANGAGVILDINGAKFYKANSSTPVTTINGTTGAISAVDVNLTGAITATSGAFTGTINAANGVFSGYVTAGNARFGVGVQTNKNGIWFNSNNYWYDDGTINAILGNIGGWTLSNSELYSGSGLSKMSLSATQGKITVGTGNHGSVDTGFYVDSAGKFSLSNQLIFNPGTGNNTSFKANGTFNNGATQITVSSIPNGSSVKKGMTVAGAGIPSNSFVTNISGSTVTIDKATSSAGTNIELTFVLDDFAELEVVGKIRGVIESTKQIGSLRLSTTISAITVVGSYPNTQTAEITTTGHAFLTDEKIIIENLPTTNNLNLLNRSFAIKQVVDSVKLIVDITGTATVNPDNTISSVNAGTVTSLSGTATLQELTMGLHPAESSGTTYEHSAGSGIRLNKYNWWFTNNQFRVGTSGTYFSWNGSQFVISGSNGNTGYDLKMGIGSTAGTNYYSIVQSDQTPTYNSTNTPFYVNDSGQFSLGQKLTFSGGNLSVTGNITATSGTFTGTVNATSGNIGGFTLSNSAIYSTYNQNYMSDKDVLFTLPASTYWFGRLVAGGTSASVGVRKDSATLSKNSFTGYLNVLSYTKTSNAGIVQGAQAVWVNNGTSKQRFQGSAIGSGQLVSGKTYNFSVYVQSIANTEISGIATARVDILRYNASTGGTLLGTITGSPQTINNSTYARLACPFAYTPGEYYEFVVIAENTFNWSSGSGQTKDVLNYALPMLSDGYPEPALFSGNGNQAISLKTNNNYNIGDVEYPNMLEAKVNGVSETVIDDQGNLFVTGPSSSLSQVRAVTGGSGQTNNSGLIIVSHGLSSTPSSVVATVNSDAFSTTTPRLIYVGNISSTSFTVYATTAGSTITGAAVNFTWMAVQ